jgi:hypothetical protein
VKKNLEDMKLYYNIVELYEKTTVKNDIEKKKEIKKHK